MTQKQTMLFPVIKCNLCWVDNDCTHCIETTHGHYDFLKKDFEKIKKRLSNADKREIQAVSKFCRKTGYAGFVKNLHLIENPRCIETKCKRICERNPTERISNENGQLADCIIVNMIERKDFDTLSLFASRVLKEGGSVLVLYEKSQLPVVIKSLSLHLKYHWHLCFKLEVENEWIPVLWFVKEHYGDNLWVGDVIKNGIADLFYRFSNANQTILTNIHDAPLKMVGSRNIMKLEEQESDKK